MPVYFLRLSEKLPDSDIIIKTDDKLNTTISCEKAKFTIPGKDGEDFAYLPIIEKMTVWKSLSSH